MDEKEVRELMEQLNRAGAGCSDNEDHIWALHRILDDILYVLLKEATSKKS